MHTGPMGHRKMNEDMHCRSLRKEERKKVVTQSCLTLCDPMDCSLPGYSVHGIFQARVLECVAISEGTLI